MNPNESDTPEAATPEAQRAPATKRPRRRRDAAASTDTAAAATAATAGVDPAERHAEEHPGEAGAAERGEATAAAGDAPGAAAENGRDGRRRRRPRRRGRRQGQRTEGGGASADLMPLPRAPFATLPSDDAQEVFAEVLAGGFDTPPAPGEPGAAAAHAPIDTGVVAIEAPGSELDEDEALEPERPGALAGEGGPPKRILAPEPEAPKLHKILAQAGIGSRRDLEQMIAEGRIAVNGQPAHVGQRVSFGDRITVDGKPVRVRIHPPAPRVLAYHKPAGEIVTYDDPQQRPTVFRRLPRLQQGKWQSVGRLDINTEGLLLFTNSGDLANRLMHPRFGVEREYAVRVLGLLTDEERDRMLEGIELEGHRVAARRIEDGGGDGANHWYRLVIAEGRNREVRRLIEAVGHVVSRLIRIRYGNVVLPRGLKRGVWVDLSPDDVKALQRLTGTERREPGPERADAAGPRRRRRGRGSRAEGAAGPPAAMPGEAPPRASELEDLEHHGPIPNPLQQTFDKRAIQQARKQRRFDEDGPIPNPLQQTFDRRALQQPERTAPPDNDDEEGPIPNPLQQTYDRRFVQGGKPGAAGGGAGGGRRRKKGGARTGGPGGGTAQPDPMRTAVGYIGADAAHKGKGGRRGPRGR
jgi:23S rRNA pseudouridine2605 synthase